MGTEQTVVLESLFKWIKQNSACGTADKVCETITVPNPKACANITLCPTCRPNAVKENILVKTSVFPNPTTDLLNIRLTNDEGTIKTAKILIYNTLGQLITTDILTRNTEGVFSKQINLAEFPNGMFFIKFYGDEKWLGDKPFVKLSK